MGNVSATGHRGGRPAVLAAWLFLGAALFRHHDALAQAAIPDCATPVARLVSLQGHVELQRAGSSDWLTVARLDTTLCGGDRLRTDALSRAALFVEPETLVRVDQNTAIRINQSTDEIEVEFFAAELVERMRPPQSCGAGYFISRFPRKFKVTTPHMNAAVEGTEFMVQSSCDATKLTVLEGKVASRSVGSGETRLVVAGNSVQTGPGGDAAITAIVKPRDAVLWVLRYPPISDEAGGASLSEAERSLRSGGVDEALAAIDTVLADDPSNSDGHALRSVIQVAKNDKDGAKASAIRATEVGAGNYRAWLALSYAQQAGFNLDAALASARRAEELKTDSALAHARVAELLLSLGDVRRAEEAARAAVASGPAESHAHSMLGFVHLAEIDAKAARADFQAAIERDSFAALPRLGLGLAMIREGELKQGREQIEIAVALDPTNSLLRSYVGKAYYEENTKERNALAAVQFGLAKTLDPNDPTPWFYEAILRDSQSRPREALASFQESSDLNGNRAVFRSRELLDEDAASRSASLASVYNELGFHQVGVIQATDSLATDPGSSSAHRFLADMNATLPRYDIARASELLQAQLRQPLGTVPLQAQLANDILFQSAFFGASTIGLSEFNPLFVREGLRTQVFGLLGSDDTWGDQVILSGLNGGFSFAVSQFAAETDGIRENDDDSIRQYDGLAQWRISPATAVQVEVTDWSRESGDLVSAFDPAFNSDVLRNREDVSSQRVGLRRQVNASSDLLLSVIHQDRRASLEFPDPDFPLTLLGNQDSWKAEAQYQLKRDAINVVLGTSYFEADSLESLVTPDFEFQTPGKPHHFNAYGYLTYAVDDAAPRFEVGLSYDELHSEVGEQSELNPKLGVSWRISELIRIRAAGFRTLKRRINSDQGLEPTQIAGFNQLFDDRNGTVAEGGGAALDFNISPEAFVGLQATRRNLKVPSDLDGTTVFEQQRQDVASAYAYWLPADEWSLSIEARIQDFEKGATFDRLQLNELPISVRFLSPDGVWAGVTVTGVDQSGRFVGPGGVLAPGSDSYWLVDAFVAFRLPQRGGTISLEGTNLFDESFRFQELSQEAAPRYVPEARYFLRASFSF